MEGELLEQFKAPRYVTVTEKSVTVVDHDGRIVEFEIEDHAVFDGELYWAKLEQTRG